MLKRKGQSTIEMGILLTAVILALVAMQVYLKRALQGRYRQGADSIGEAYDPAATYSNTSMSHASSVTTVSNTQPANRTVTTCEGAYCGDATYTVEVTTSTATTHYDDTNRSSYESVAAP